MDANKTNADAASGSKMSDRPLQVLAACTLRDLPVLEITARYLRETIPLRKLHVVAPDADCKKMQRILGNDVSLIPENEFIPGMTLGKLRALKAPGFPKSAGWYFQQFLKLQFCFIEPEDDFYLIWDADTVPLRPMHFFDSEGKMLLTNADENHAAYFETYRRLFGDDPHREFSFIAQHMLVQKSIAREMLATIEQHVPGDDGWAWKIMRSLPTDQGMNLFSEYETYGHYLKTHYPDKAHFIERKWLREFPKRMVQGIPSEKKLADLSKQYDYVAFERAMKGWRRWAKLAKHWLRG